MSNRTAAFALAGGGALIFFLSMGLYVQSSRESLPGLDFSLPAFSSTSYADFGFVGLVLFIFFFITGCTFRKLDKKTN